MRQGDGTGEMTAVPRVLLVEDEAGLRLTLSDRLVSEGYAVDTASDGEAGLAHAASGAYDLIVLDVMLPRMNGFDVCREVRRRGVTTPILMLTARLEALLRRRGSGVQSGGDTYRFGNVVVDFRRAEVTRDGQQVDLSAREFKLLRHFIAHRGE